MPNVATSRKRTYAQPAPAVRPYAHLAGVVRVLEHAVHDAPNAERGLDDGRRVGLARHLLRHLRQEGEPRGGEACKHVKPAGVGPSQPTYFPSTLCERANGEMVLVCEGPLPAPS